jgi:cytidine deaminase
MRYHGEVTMVGAYCEGEALGGRLGMMPMTNKRADRLMKVLDQSGFRGDAGLRATLANPEFAGVVPVDWVEHVIARSGLSLSRVMDALLPFAAVYADPLISHYSASAVARGVTGNLYLGANAEYPGLPLNHTLHAEQTVVLNAWSYDEPGLTHLAITAAPCGLCRQFLYELNRAEDLQILLPGLAPVALPGLLPRAFGPQNLDVRAGLMGAIHEPSLSLEVDSDDGVTAATLAAAKRSYAPYSHDFAAVVLVTADGATFTGRYAENAAFNPSVAPMASALASLRLGGQSPSDVIRAVLVAGLDTVGHGIGSQVLLGSVSQVELEVLRATVREPQLL